MPTTQRTRPKTRSDDPLERRIYEQAGKEHEEFMLLEFTQLLEDMPPPAGWPDPPPNRKRGRQQEYTWRMLVPVLLLQTMHKLDARAMSSHLRANPHLVERLGMPRPPSHSTIHRARNRIPEDWLHELNRRLVGGAKGGRPEDPQKSVPVWIQLE